MVSCFQRQTAQPHISQALLLCFGLTCVGCTSFQRDRATVEKNPTAGTSVQLIDDLARPYGMNTIRIEGVSMVRGLNGTGGDPAPSSQREMLLEEMRIHDVDKPNQVLASKNTALVTVQAVLPPGIQKGDPIDVEVRSPARQNVNSLQGGWLMPTRLREYARVENRVAEGHLRGFAKGDVLVDAMFSGTDDPIMHNRGRVLSGGVASKTRNLGLTVSDEHLSVATSARIGEAINQRFHIYDRGLQRPVANPKRDRFIELLVHPRYQENVIRYMRVIQSIPVRYGAGGIAERLRTLETELMTPSQSAATALKLEALGQDGIPVLRAGLQHGDSEVRFYSSEALAYLDDSTAVNGLVNSIKTEPAFRKRAFIALGAMDDPKAHEALIELMRHESVETRYAAFRTLRRIMPDDPHVNGERLGTFFLHVIQTDGSPLVHVLRSERPEIVLFGADHQVQLPLVVYAGNQIVVKGGLSGEVEVTKIVAGEDDQTIKCPAQLEPIIRSIVDLGGTYPDVVQAIAQAKKNNVLVSRLEFDAVPASNRTYQRAATPPPARNSAEAQKKKRLTKANSTPSSSANNPLRKNTSAASTTSVAQTTPSSVAGETHRDIKAPLATAASTTAKVVIPELEPAPPKTAKTVAARAPRRAKSPGSIVFASETVDEPPLPTGEFVGQSNVRPTNLDAVRSGVEVAFANDDLPPVIDRVSQLAPLVAVVKNNEIELAPEPKPVPSGPSNARKSVASTHSLATVSDTIEFGQ